MFRPSYTVLFVDDQEKNKSVSAHVVISGNGRDDDKLSLLKLFSREAYRKTTEILIVRNWYGWYKFISSVHCEYSTRKDLQVHNNFIFGQRRNCADMIFIEIEKSIR